MSAGVYGLMAEFASPEAFLAALRRVRDDGYVRVEAYTPYAVPGLAEALPAMTTPVAWLMALGGLAGASGGFFMQWYAARIYPLNVGGRPLNSWPSFIPITFELTVLTSALVGVAALFWLARFPHLHHPVFSDPRFARATQDRFFVCIRANDPRYGNQAAWRALAATAPESIAEVAA
jgi:hypothetical protein